MKKILLPVLISTTLLTGCLTSKPAPAVEEFKVYHLSFSDADAMKVTTETCKRTTEQDIIALFDRWNTALKSGNPNRLVVYYGYEAVFLPDQSNKVHLTSADKRSYFREFMIKKPSATVDFRKIEIHCNTATDTGLYTFTYGKSSEKTNARYTFNYKWNGKQWLITSHHSSVMPEKQ